ncbi:MAG TPA: histidinol dehydrogenase [Chitinophagaceae bacterium]|nr:histidinol dehydrogenase [Chitinophagaceae bacterium]
MQIYKYPEKKDLASILARPTLDFSDLEEKVAKILSKIKRKGDKAVFKYTAKFDGVELDALQVTEEEINEASQHLAPNLKEAIQQAAKNIESFHRFQQHEPDWVVTMPGIVCSRRNVPIQKVGLYIPGGTAPLFSTVLMLGIPAKIAGCQEIILCSPPDEEKNINPAILFAAQLVGITKIFKIGGVQAIGAMAYGTETVPAVYKIFGPGNQFVTCAKMLVQKDGVGIDMPAGPSEVCVLADETANLAFVAADLLSQAEHGIDSQVLLVVNRDSSIIIIEDEIRKQLADLPRKEIVEQALENSKIILVQDLLQGVEVVNEYAPEHLIIACKNEEAIADKIVNAGSVFLGAFSPEAVGDYASGTNHTLPTNGFARTYSGVSVDSFVKKITYQKLSEEGLKNIAQTVITMAEAEGLKAHARAVEIRMNSIN